MKKFRLECDGHWWNFDTKAQAESAAKVLASCSTSYVIYEVWINPNFPQNEQDESMQG